MGSLLVQRLPIADAAGEELGPFRNLGNRIGLLREKSPQRRMVPAQVMTGAVPMGSNAVAQLAHLVDQLIARHAQKIVVHRVSNLRLGYWVRRRDFNEDRRLSTSSATPAVTEVEASAAPKEPAVRERQHLRSRSAPHHDQATGPQSPSGSRS